MSGAFCSVFIDGTVRYIVRMLPGLLAAAAAYLCLYRWRERRLTAMGLASSRSREGAMLLFWLFCGGMAVLTLTPSWFDWLPLLRGLRPHGPFFSLGDWDLTPDLGIFCGGSVYLGLWTVYMLLGNIVMFVPFGFFAALLWRGYRWRRALLTGAAISGSIECWQLLVGRAFDVNDLILNSFGVLCGYWLWKLSDRLFPCLTARCRPRPLKEGTL